MHHLSTAVFKMLKRKKILLCCILDVSIAFDSIGHDHILTCLRQFGIPNNLYKLIEALLVGNTIQIEVHNSKTIPITVQRGVPQGSPLSPLLFNLAIDFILQNLTDHNIAQKYGYTLSDHLPNLSAFAFADDIALISKGKKEATALIDLAESLLASIGLHTNSAKCTGIMIRNGILSSGELTTLQGSVIKCISDKSERIRYLGVDFNDEICFDKKKVITSLSSDLNALIHSNLLKPDQKIKILDQYLWPKLIYPLQCAPLNQLSNNYLRDIDKIIRSAVKEILQLPDDTPNSMLYASKKFRGLGIVRAEWEASLQHFNICSRLEKVKDRHLHHVRNLKQEQEFALKRLKISDDMLSLNTTGKKLRETLRQKSFQEWCQLPHKGKGVSLYEDCPPFNSWIPLKNIYHLLNMLMQLRCHVICRQFDLFQGEPLALPAAATPVAARQKL